MKVGSFDAESFLAPAREAADISLETEVRITEQVRDVVEKHLDGWRENYSSEYERLDKVINLLDHSLAAILVTEWNIIDWEFPPFFDEKSAFHWLQGNRDGIDEEVVEPCEGLDSIDQWSIRSIWLVRKDYETQLINLVDCDHARAKDTWIGTWKTGSTLPHDMQDLIVALSRIWLSSVFSELKLGQRNPNTDNPLLRFIDSCLKIAVGENRPEKKTLHTFIQDHLRPKLKIEDRIHGQFHENEDDNYVVEFLDKYF